MKRILAVTTLLLAPLAGIVSAGVKLDFVSNITVREEGPFDTAAGELRGTLVKYLKLALGRDELNGTGAPVELVVRTRASYWYQLPPGAIADVRDMDAFEIEVTSQPRAVITITGRTPVATGYGVMAFLEDHIGVHWAFPGELGLCLPPRKTVELKEGRSVARPFVVARVMSGLAARDPARDRKQRPTSGVAMEERGFFSAEDFFKSMRMHHESVTHNMIHIFPIEESLAKHPEIFPLKEDGQRFVPATRAKGEGAGGNNNFQAWHPCYTNPKTLEVAIAKGRAAYDGRRLFYSLGINDGQRVQCQCAECRRVGWPQSYYQFVTRVAEALRGNYPPRMVGVLAYGDVGLPPRALKLPDNVLVNVAGDRHSLWHGLAPRLGTYEYIYGAGYVVPNLPLEIIQENFRYYRANQLLLYRAEAYPLWAFDAPKLYIIRRLLWNPEDDVQRLLREFCDRTFGAAGSAMYRYYVAAGSWRKDDVRPGDVTPVWGKEWPFKDTQQFSRCPPDYHARLDAALREAAAGTLTDAERKRLDMVAAFTDFSAVFTDIWRFKETVFSGAADLARAAELGAKLATRKEAVMARLREHPEWFRGSSVQFDTFTEREWPLVPLEQQLQTAVTTARHPSVRSGGESPALARRTASLLVPLGRKEHPWHKPEQTVAMDSTRGVAEGFGFKTVTNVVIHSDDDPRRNGRLKAQWLHAIGRNLPTDSRPLVLEVAMKGADGLLELRATGNGRVLAECMVPFATGPTAAMRRFVIDPSSFSGATTAKGALPNLQLYFLWRADQSSACLEGTATLKPLTPLP